MEYQVSNWYYFNWLGGDHIVEQHVHDLDVMNGMMNDAHPVRANGMGGRQVRTPEWGEANGYGRGGVGEIFDHHSIEFEYADIEGHGRGSIYLDGRDQPLRWDRGPDGHQVEHDVLFAAILAGEPCNEVGYSAQSSMTAILGRMATYSGKSVEWDEAIRSDLDLAPARYAWDADPPVLPDETGAYACAMPGVTRAW